LKLHRENIVVRLLENERRRQLRISSDCQRHQGYSRTKRPAEGKEAFHDGLIFHRVIPQFMIQGGCPQGSGWAGLATIATISSFAEAFEAGKLSHGHSGPGTNGASSFLPSRRHRAGQQAHHLGEIVEGRTWPTKSRMCHAIPTTAETPVSIKKLRIERIASGRHGMLSRRAIAVIHDRIDLRLARFLVIWLGLARRISWTGTVPPG